MCPILFHRKAIEHLPGLNWRNATIGSSTLKWTSKSANTSKYVCSSKPGHSHFNTHQHSPWVLQKSNLSELKFTIIPIYVWRSDIYLTKKKKILAKSTKVSDNESRDCSAQMLTLFPLDCFTSMYWPGEMTPRCQRYPAKLAAIHTVCFLKIMSLQLCLLLQ